MNDINEDIVMYSTVNHRYLKLGKAADKRRSRGQYINTEAWPKIKDGGETITSILRQAEVVT